NCLRQRCSLRRRLGAVWHRRDREGGLLQASQTERIQRTVLLASGIRLGSKGDGQDPRAVSEGTARERKCSAEVVGGGLVGEGSAQDFFASRRSFLGVERHLQRSGRCSSLEGRSG